MCVCVYMQDSCMAIFVRQYIHTYMYIYAYM